jgi:hypothetical protein
MPVLVLVFLVLSISSTNSWGFGNREHTEITQGALPFLRTEILNQIVDGDLDEDAGADGWHSENHFDACEFEDSSRNIQGKYNDLISETIASGNYPFASVNYPFHAAWTFGELVHPVQDFYSHSNWVELPFIYGIVAKNLGNWPTFRPWHSPSPEYYHVRIAEGEPPDGTSMTSGVTPKVTFDFQDYWVLFTHGREWWRLSDRCPEGTEGWNHAQLNKDDPNHDDYRGDLALYPALHE